MSKGLCKVIIHTDGDTNWQATATLHHICSDWPIDEITMRLPKAAVEAIHDHVVKVIADGVKTDVTQEDKAASRSYVARHLYRIELDFVGGSNG